MSADAPACAFLQPYHAMITQGEAARFQATTLAEVARWWTRTVDELEQESDLPGHPTTGPIAFVAMPFDASAERPITAIVPSEVLVREKMPDGSTLAWRTWITEQEPGDPTVRKEEAPRRPLGVEILDDGLAAFRSRVAVAADYVNAEAARKLVVCREVVVRAQAPIDLRWVVRDLERTCPGLAIFSVDGLIGASPQVVLHRNRGLVRTQVLSGSAPTDDDELPVRLTDMLRPGSPVFQRHKDSVDVTVAQLAEAALARPHPSGPTLRRLPGVAHLKTDVTTVVDDSSSTLELLDRLHPGVDMVGLPYDRANGWLREFEGLDRRRFAAPVGWIDGAGNATFALSLRCGELEPDGVTMRLFAEVAIIQGLGEDEAVQLSNIKLRAMCGALGLV